MSINSPSTPAGSIEVRPASLVDLIGIHELAKRVLPPVYVTPGLLDKNEIQALIDGFWTPEYFATVLDGDGVLWVATQEDSVVGMAEVARLDANAAVLWKLYVDDGLRGNGVGSRLLAGVAAQLWEGTERFFTEYVTGNDGAAAFYAKHGFEFDREEPDARSDVDATYTWVVRDASASIVIP